MFKVENTALVSVVLLIASVLGSAVHATELDYPEISIVPRYSDRLEMEAKAEPMRKWGAVAALSAPYLASTVVGLSLFNPQMAMAYWTPLSVGTLGLIGMGVFTAFLHPYADGLAVIAPLKNGTLREKLYRERVAEEQIESAARMGERMRWFTATVNAAANTYTLMSYISGAGFLSPIEKMVGIVIGGAGALVSLTPLFFRPYWIDVAHEQESYRKRIFSPVASVAVFPVGSGYVPGILLGLQF